MVMLRVLCLMLVVGATLATLNPDDRAAMAKYLDEIYGNRAYRTVLLKRSPSIGLSLAEYMAEPGKQDNFHFLPSRRNEA